MLKRQSAKHTCMRVKNNGSSLGRNIMALYVQEQNVSVCIGQELDHSKYLCLVQPISCPLFVVKHKEKILMRKEPKFADKCTSGKKSIFSYMYFVHRT